MSAQAEDYSYLTFETTDGSIMVAYSGTTATVTVAGNIAQYVTPTLQSGVTVSGGSSVNRSNYSGNSGGPGFGH